jgi:hypothetical protein
MIDTERLTAEFARQAAIPSQASPATMKLYFLLDFIR